ncbi:hypothetical protein [Novosphingobium kaempferiae]|uniref:hypothetical protein n=1 Tax=Novosphingobium kaempferiae TaxID=2896849 RepID=UPI001E42CEEB|nr:hypothetical protein [Novosphingobium kaempferiae]
MGYSNRALHRRPRTEQAVLGILRGERKALRSPAEIQAFDQLGALAGANGIAICDIGTAYLGDGELRLLSWLAAAQRPTKEVVPPDDVQLYAAIAECASLLLASGMRLYPLTLYRRHLTANA